MRRGQTAAHSDGPRCIQDREQGPEASPGPSLPGQRGEGQQLTPWGRDGEKARWCRGGAGGRGRGRGHRDGHEQQDVEAEVRQKSAGRDRQVDREVRKAEKRDRWMATRAPGNDDPWVEILRFCPTAALYPASATPHLRVSVRACVRACTRGRRARALPCARVWLNGFGILLPEQMASEIKPPGAWTERGHRRLPWQARLLASAHYRP